MARLLHGVGADSYPKGCYSVGPMATVNFTQNLRRHVQCPSTQAEGATLKEVLTKVFQEYPVLQGYLLDDQGGLRDHVTVFVDGEQVFDRVALGDAVGADSEVYVMQALSGG